MRTPRPPKLGKSFSIKFSPKRELLLSVGRSVYCWAESGRKKLATAHPFSHPAYLDISPDSETVAVKNTYGEIAVLSLPTLERRDTLQQSVGGQGCQLYFSTCGKYMVDGSWQGDLVGRHVTSGAVEFAERFDHTMLTWLSHTGDRDTFVYVRQPKAIGDAPPQPSLVAVRRWPFGSNQEQIVKGGWRQVMAAAISHDAKRVAVLHHTGGALRLEVVDRSSSSTISTEDFPYGGTNESLSWSPDGHLLACVQRGRIAFFESDTLELVASHEDPHPCFVEFSPDGGLVALGSWEQGTVRATNSLFTHSDA